MVRSACGTPVAGLIEAGIPPGSPPTYPPPSHGTPTPHLPHEIAYNHPPSSGWHHQVR